MQDLTEQITERHNEGAAQRAVEIYDDADWNTVEEHIKAHFGDHPSVFHEIASPDIQIDICIIPPAGEQDFYTLVTIGMGAHKMQVPKALSEKDLERAELLICLPPYWKLNKASVQDEHWYWPIRVLKSTARLPIHEHSWLGYGHTVSMSADNSKTYHESVDFSGVVLLNPNYFGQESFSCTLSNGEEVHFYMLVPLYSEELQFKLVHGDEALMDLIQADPEQEPLLLADPERKNYCSPEILDEPWAMEYVEALETWENETTDYWFYMTLNLNARLQPMHRHKWEDALQYILEQRSLGEIDGGGTMQLPNGEIESCDIEINLIDDTEETIAELAEIVNEFGVPKGSKLIAEDFSVPVGDLEGMALYLNGTELPDEVYQNCDVNHVIERMNALLGDGDIGELYSWWEGPKDTALYFYGKSYEKMLAAVRSFIEKYPLCQKCTIDEIA